MKIFRIATAGLLVSAWHAPAAAQVMVDLSWQPSSQTVQVGDEVHIDLIATSVGPVTQPISGLDVVMSWDPNHLLFMGNDNSSAPYAWFLSGFLPEQDGINLNLTDGDALFTALSQVGTPADVPTGAGLLVTTMKFLAVTPTPLTSLSFVASQGQFGQTRVLADSPPNFDVTGDISSTGDVTIDAVPRLYCTAKVNSQGCLPQIGSSGVASVTSPSPFTVFATMELNSRNGLYFYGLLGPANIPFFNGTLCVTPPLRRTAVQNSGGTPPPAMDCSGVYTFAMNALIQSGLDPLLVAGQPVNAQYWSRDPPNVDGTGVALSNGIEFVIGP